MQMENFFNQELGLWGACSFKVWIIENFPSQELTKLIRLASSSKVCVIENTSPYHVGFSFCLGNFYFLENTSYIRNPRGLCDYNTAATFIVLLV
jgi:hypothetical protein